MSSQSYLYNPTERTLAAAGDGFSCPRLTTAGRTALTLTAGDKGMMVYDTTLTTLCIWNGTAWEFVTDNSNGFISVKDFGAKGDGVTDDTAAIQAAINSVASGANLLFFPGGSYKISSPINLLSNITIFGVGGNDGSRVFGTHSGNLFQYSNISFCKVSGMAFDGSGCTAFAQTSFGANYTENFTWNDCHFYGQLTECILGNLIFPVITQCTFGYYGTVNILHRHIVSTGSATNLTNVGYVALNRFYNAKGNESVRIDSGEGWTFFKNNWETNACLPLRLNGVLSAEILSNFFEGNVAAQEVEISVGSFVIDSGTVVFNGNQLHPNAAIVQIVKINNLLCRLEFENNSGDITGKNVTNAVGQLISETGNQSLAGSPQFRTFQLTDASGAGLVLIGGLGTYNRNDDLVNFSVSVTYPVTVNGSNAKLGGLPFPAATINTLIGIDNTLASLGWATDAAASTCVPYTTGTLTPRTNAQMSGAVIYLSGTYRI